jgi:hypothetical protein
MISCSRYYQQILFQRAKSGIGKDYSPPLTPQCPGCIDNEVLQAKAPFGQKIIPFMIKCLSGNFLNDEKEIVRLLDTRSRLFVTSILLCLALAATIFCAVQTVRAIQHFQLTRSQIVQGDVNTIQPWMTIHYISRVYAVPEEYLIDHISIPDSRQVSNVPLRTLAARYNRSVDGLIRELQIAIKAYRKQNYQHLYFPGSPPRSLPVLERSKS